jgi:hypothetical protein
MKIKNVGGMPTPTTRSVLAYIKPNDCGPAMLNRWVVSEGYDRFVQPPRGLELDATTNVPCATLLDGRIVGKINTEDEYLAFFVAPVDPVRHQRGEAFSATASLTIRAQMTPFGRDFDSFVVKPMPFTITVSCENEPCRQFTLASPWWQYLCEVLGLQRGAQGLWTG